MRETGRCWAAGFEDGGWGREPKDAGHHEKLGKDKNRPSPELPEGMQLCRHLDFSQLRLVLDF